MLAPGKTQGGMDGWMAYRQNMRPPNSPALIGLFVESEPDTSGGNFKCSPASRSRGDWKPPSRPMEVGRDLGLVSMSDLACGMYRYPVFRT